MNTDNYEKERDEAASRWQEGSKMYYTDIDFKRGADWATKRAQKTMIPMIEVEKLVECIRFIADDSSFNLRTKDLVYEADRVLNEYKQFIENRNKTEEK